MIITKELLKNLELKYGDFSAERCAEVNEMKIKNPYYPRDYFTPGEFFDAEKTPHNFVYAMDGQIAYVHAFYPMPIIRRESAEDYDDIYLLFIEDEWFELIFNFVDGAQLITENKKIIRDTYCLKENEKLNKRSDRNEMIYLIGQLRCGKRNISGNKNGKFCEVNIIYRGEIGRAHI